VLSVRELPGYGVSTCSRAVQYLHQGPLWRSLGQLHAEAPPLNHINGNSNPLGHLRPSRTDEEPRATALFSSHALAADNDGRQRLVLMPCALSMMWLTAPCAFPGRLLTAT